MDLTLSDEEQAVREAFAGFFAKQSTIDRVREAEEKGGFDAALWQSAVATGIPTMAVPEDLGGGGAELTDMFLVAREAGRRVAPIPLAEVAVAARLLARTALGAPLIEAIGDGLLPTVAVQPAVDGVARLVPGGAVAEIVVALAGDDLVMVRGGDATPTPNLGGLPLADRRVDGSDGERTVLATGAEARDLYRQAMSEWKTLTAALLVGIQSEAQRIGIDYALSRKVFGTQLAWFQTVQHRFAEVATAGVGADLLTLEAAWAHTRDPDRFAALADMSLVFAAEVAFRTCAESLQFHGGYGYTLEYDIQIYYRRARALPLAAGPVGHQLRALADRLFATTTPQGGHAANG